MICAYGAKKLGSPTLAWWNSRTATGGVDESAKDLNEFPPIRNPISPVGSKRSSPMRLFGLGRQYQGRVRYIPKKLGTFDLIKIGIFTPSKIGIREILVWYLTRIAHPDF
jgi:hypothetical protein